MHTGQQKNLIERLLNEYDPTDANNREDMLKEAIEEAYQIGWDDGHTYED